MPAGMKLPVIDKAGEWYAVAGNKDANWDTGWVKASVVTPIVEDVAADLFDALVDKINAVIAKYANNQYFRATGFTMSLSVPPSVDITFEFK